MDKEGNWQLQQNIIYHLEAEKIFDFKIYRKPLLVGYSKVNQIQVYLRYLRYIKHFVKYFNKDVSIKGLLMGRGYRNDKNI